MYNNVDLISETYEDTAMGKLQIRRFLSRSLHSGLTTVFSDKGLRISTTNLQSGPKK